MALTKAITKFGMTTAAFAAAGGLMATNAETATAATFTVQADILLEENGGAFTDIGDVFGSFDYDLGTNIFSNISLNSIFDGAFPFAGFTTTYDTFVDGSFDFLTARASGSTLDGITLIFPDLNTIPLGSTAALRAGSVTLISEQFSVSAPLAGSITAVPTPALLPGLIGLGVAALRRKNDETVEENA